MANEDLSVYLNDHLAGSTAGLELLDELRQIPGLEAWARQLRADIEEDRQVLESVMRSADISHSAARQAAAWVTEKLASLKTRMDGPAGSALHRLELIEALALGIEGKRALWTALQAVGDRDAGLQRPDYARLLERADQQRRVVESRRLEAAVDALSRR